MTYTLMVDAKLHGWQYLSCFYAKSTVLLPRSEDNCIIGGDNGGGGGDCHLSFQWERCRSINPPPGANEKERGIIGRECRQNRDCRSCKSQEDCVWTRRKLQSAEEGDRFRWDCLTRSAVEMVGGTHLLIPWQCPKVTFF